MWSNTLRSTYKACRTYVARNILHALKKKETMPRYTTGGSAKPSCRPLSASVINICKSDVVGAIAVATLRKRQDGTGQLDEAEGTLEYWLCQPATLNRLWEAFRP